MAQRRPSDGRGWIDTTAYYGFCRRAASDRFRFNERRRHETGTEPPSLPTLLRKLRVMSMSLNTPETRVTFLDHVNAAVDLAHARDCNSCARALDDLAHLIMQAGVDAARLGPEADRRLAAIVADVANA